MSFLYGDRDDDPIALFEIPPRLAQLMLQIPPRDPPRELHLLWLLAKPRPLFQRAPHLPISSLDLAPRRDAHDRLGRGRDELDDLTLRRREREERLEAVFCVRELVRVWVEDVDVVKRDLSVRRSTAGPRRVAVTVVALGFGGQWRVFKVASRGRRVEGGWDAGSTGGDASCGWYLGYLVGGVRERAVEESCGDGWKMVLVLNRSFGQTYGETPWFEVGVTMSFCRDEWLFVHVSCTRSCTTGTYKHFSIRSHHVLPLLHSCPT